MFRSSTFIALVLIIITSIIFSFTGSETKPYPVDYFSPPVKGALRLSGTFGELRSNHFHSGIDIKGSIGVPLYAAADGYVSRIKVEAGGYGNVLYISHPKGYTTVYAHMNHFTPELEEFVKSQQYSKERFGVDLYPAKGRFNFKKGEKIGAMGTSGYSFGPHLHFEIRHSRDGSPINPLLFGIPVADDQRPRMHQLKVYSLNDQLETQDAQIFSLVPKYKGYGIKGDTISMRSDRISLALKVYDHMNGVRNWNGIYSLDVYLEDELMYNFEMETFSFSESRYLNAHLDYAEQVTHKAYFNRCFRLPGNRLSIYGEQKNEGVIPLSLRRAKKVHMVATDVAGNQCELTFWVKQKGPAPLLETNKSYNYLLPYNQESVIDNGSIYAHFPKGALYENCYLQYQLATDQSSNVYSSVHQLHHATTPVHRYFDLAIRPVVLPESLMDKAFIALCGKDNEVTNYGGTWKNSMLQTKVRSFGDYCIMVDNIPPSIDPVNFKSDLRAAKRIDFIIKDNYPTGGKARGLRFKATVDGRWILMKYDAKKDRLTHYFDEVIRPGKHQFRLTVTDALNNTSVFEKSFTR